VKLTHILLVCGVVVTAAGCSSTQIYEGPAPGVRIEHPSAPNAGIRYNSVAILDRNLQTSYIYENGKIDHGHTGKIAVEGAGARRSQTGTVEAWAMLRNRTNYPLQIEGRVIFFDKSKAPLEGPTSWQRVFLPPNSVNTFKEFSTNITEVGYFYIELREGS
jgi:hypothetical protein